MTQPTIPISIPSLCTKVTTPFSQILLANLDESFDIKHALLDGSLEFHSHPDNDEAFYLLSGTLKIQLLPDGENQVDENGTDVRDVKMSVGNLFVVQRGVFHRPVGMGAHVLVMEMKGIPGGDGKIAVSVTN